MGVQNRPVTCAATNKRLRSKSWYYRNGQYFYNKRAYEEHRAKAVAEQASKAKTDEAKAPDAVAPPPSS